MSAPIIGSAPPPMPQSAPAVTDGPVGIGGWMILAIIGFVGTIVLTLANLVTPDALAGLKAIVGGESEELRSLRLPVGLSMLFGTAVVVSAVACLVLIFRKKRAIVPVTTVHYLLLAAAGLVDLWGEFRLKDLGVESAIDPSTFKDAIRGIVIAAIWIPYFRVSRRVRNTCVR